MDVQEIQEPLHHVVLGKRLKNHMADAQDGEGILQRDLLRVLPQKAITWWLTAVLASSRAVSASWVCLL